MARQRGNPFGAEHSALAAEDVLDLVIIKPRRTRGHHAQHPIGDPQAGRLGDLRGARLDARSPRRSTVVALSAVSMISISDARAGS
jgi:hypothetical protein